jgi:hypothetical protein
MIPHKYIGYIILKIEQAGRNEKQLLRTHGAKNLMKTVFPAVSSS